MTPREADRIIKVGKPVTIYAPKYNETFTTTFTQRDRRTISDDKGGKWHRDELELIEDR